MRIAVIYSMRSVCIPLLSLFIMTSANAYEQAFPRTDPGVIEVKTIPAGRLLESRGSGSYFEQSNRLFRPLFSYIQSHDISMTVPVEAKIDPGTMYFWVAADQVDKATGDSGQVRVVDVGARHVAAIGYRGAYSRENFMEARAELMAWLEERNLQTKGEPYAVYWNGPFTPWLLKRAEVQVELADTQVE